jgi:2-polyprenyl-6-hydroxyphenyl methylase/3-demethylubiquinone-9 3-methyltransferase
MIRETRSVKRFRFGQNWKAYSRQALTTERVEQARAHFEELFDGIPLKGKSFLDIGFGQGLSLMIAQQAGAQVVGLDIDEDNREALSVTMQFFTSSHEPQIVIGSIHDETVVKRLDRNGGYDVVHAWGVLHHTGNMELAIANASRLVSENGYFVLAIYNRHWSSVLWLFVKWLYNRSSGFFQRLIVGLCYPIIYAAKWIVTGRNPKRQIRGMDFYFNVVDWVGGYPYEYANRDEIVSRLDKLGFDCVKIILADVPTGCNQFVFVKRSSSEQESLRS